MADSIGFGIVGAGMIAPMHIAAIEATEGARLVAVADTLEGRAAAVGREKGIASYTDHRKLLENSEVDVVCICSPSGLRGGLAIDAARSGKHVLAEKPIEITLDRIDAVIQECDRAGVLLAAVMQYRFLEGNQALKMDIDAGIMGKLVLGDAYIKWFRPQSYYDSSAWRGTWAMDGGGVLMNQGIHCVDLLQWFMGPVRSISARTATLTRDIEVEDTAVACLEFDSGAMGVIEACTSAYPGTPARMEVRGQRGTIVTENGQTVMRSVEGESESACGRIEGSGGASDPSAIGIVGHQRQISDLVAAIKEGRPPLIDGHEARKAVEIILAIYESSRTGLPVKLPLFPRT